MDFLTVPLFHLGENPISALSLVHFALLAVLIILAEAILRRVIVQRALARTHWDEGIRFAIARITGYMFITLGFYIVLKVVGVDLSSWAVLTGAIGVGLDFRTSFIISSRA